MDNQSVKQEIQQMVERRLGMYREKAQPGAAWMHATSPSEPRSSPTDEVQTYLLLCILDRLESIEDIIVTLDPQGK